MSQARTSQLIRSLAAAYASQLVSLAALFIVSPILLARLGAEEVGRWLVVLQALNILALADLGVVTAVGRQLGARLFGTSPTRVQDAKRLAENGAGVVALQYPLILIALAAFGFVSLRSGAIDLDLFGLVAVTFLTTFPSRLARELLKARQDLAFSGVVQLWGVVTTLFIQLAVVLTGHGVVGLALGWAAGEYVSAVLLWHRVFSKHREVAPKRILWPWRAKEFAYAEAGWLFLAQVSHVLASGTDLLVVNHLFGREMVTSYSLSSRLFATFAHYPLQVVVLAQPLLVALYAEKGAEVLGQRVRVLGMVAAWMSAALGCVVIACNSSFVGAWIGREFDLGIGFIALLAMTSVTRMIRFAPATALYAAGHQRIVSLNAVLSAVLSVVSAYVLGRAFGAVGVAAGYVVSVLGLDFAVLFGAYRKLIEQPLLPWLKPAVLVAAISCATWAASAWLSASYSAPSFARAIVLAGAAGAFFAVMSLPFLAQDDIRADAIPRLRAIGGKFEKLGALLTTFRRR